MRFSIALSATLFLAALLALSAGRPPEIPFQKHTIDLGASETCAFGDMNGDSKPDIVSGDYWYESPKWTPHRFRELNFHVTPADNYIDNFSDLTIDVNGDGRLDVVSCAWFGRRIAWFENPGKAAGMWKEHPVDSGNPTEFAFLVDLDNDGKARELLPQYGGNNAPVAWYEIKNGAWVKNVASPKAFGHGIGAGDVNGDGRNDILTPRGWLEAPADPRSGAWTLRAEWEFKEGLSFIHVLDVNGDGRNDVVTGNAHDYGVFWLEHGENNKWTKRMIDDSWSQAHAITLHDMNGDGRKDLLTGKRFMAHSRDPGSREPLGVYWYEIVKSADGKVDWAKHIVDYSTRTGGGMQLPVADLDGDGDLDFAAGGKSGLFLFENLTKRR